ncbi:hypothetical protein AeMF1_001347 [Aphanomyces euteiches]|nr:hypothetical protein AeMF1_001347 [Aphanomyces euteiches]KAH9193642.1 hypothetical protein AeNC1_004382 [Aphanomyces euteiches]
MAKSRTFLIVAVVAGLLAVFWPQIEEYVLTQCPIPYFGSRQAAEYRTSGDNHATNDDNNGAQLRVFTLDELKKYDGTDDSLPIYISIGGYVLDVTSGKKFYANGAQYHQFAGQACTRALAIGSLDLKDITDDTSDFTPEQIKEMDTTLEFYFGKYPKVESYSSPSQAGGVGTLAK